MPGSSPAARSSRYPRASLPLSSPTSALPDFLRDDRNSERSHRAALAEADAEHSRIRERANHVLWVHEQQEQQEALLEKTRQEAEKLRIEEERVRLVQQNIKTEEQRLQAEKAAREEQQRLRELAAKKIPPLSPVQQPKPAPTQSAAPAPAAAAAAAAAAPSAKTTTSTSSVAAPAQPSATPSQPPQPALNGIKSAAPSPFAAAPAAGPSAAPATPTTARPTPVPASAPAKIDPKRQRALQIHKNLKQLRESITTTQGNQNPALRSKAGDMRRELRKCIGQLSFDKQGNQIVTRKINSVLKEALANQVGSQMIDPSHFVFEPREPVQGAVNNGELPSLFIFVVNHVAKSMINQFINECSANTKTADPIGVLAASLFADVNFHWRGKPIIDILMAKFYVVCPVLFGARGLEKTEAGREKVGWKRRGPNAWMPESEHYDRQTGLAAGFAAISLRDFSKAKKENPYPMTHYWEAMAHILNTPPSEMSNTQCVVLKSMIDHYEQRFLLFYGNAAVAALRLALVDFPAHAKSAGCEGPAVESLVVHGKALKAKVGLALA